MHSRLATAFLVLGILTLLGPGGCAPTIKEGYLRYPQGRLMFKIPPGSWERVKVEDKVLKIPEPFSEFNVGKRPTVALTASVRPALILIWVDRTGSDYSKRLVKGFKRLEDFLEDRQKAAQRSKKFKYFEYQLFNDLVAAKTDLAAQAGDFGIRGQGEAQIYFYKGETYFYYFELQADSDVFDAVKEEFTEALKETHGY